MSNFHKALNNILDPLYSLSKVKFYPNLDFS